MHDSRMSENESGQGSVCRLEMPGFFRGARAKLQHEFQARLPPRVLPTAQWFTKHVLLRMVYKTTVRPLWWSSMKRVRERNIGGW